MNQKDKIEELERRIRELEARPVYVPIYIGSPQPNPCHQPSPWYRQPWYTSQPWSGYLGGGGIGAQGEQ